MPLTPGYGETPLPHEELTALLAEVVDLFDEPITRSDVYDLETGSSRQSLRRPDAGGHRRLSITRRASQ